MTPIQCRMARAALGWNTIELAETAGVGANTINRFERGDDARVSSVEKMRAALHAAGVLFLSDGELKDGGPGVRLAKRSETSPNQGPIDAPMVRVGRKMRASNA